MAFPPKYCVTGGSFPKKSLSNYTKGLVGVDWIGFWEEINKRNNKKWGNKSK